MVCPKLMMRLFEGLRLWQIFSRSVCQKSVNVVNAREKAVHVYEAQPTTQHTNKRVVHSCRTCKLPSYQTQPTSRFSRHTDANRFTYVKSTCARITIVLDFRSSSCEASGADPTRVSSAAREVCAKLVLYLEEVKSGSFPWS